MRWTRQGNWKRTGEGMWTPGGPAASSQKAYCEQHGLRSHSLSYWHRRLAKGPGPSGARSLLALVPAVRVPSAAAGYAEPVAPQPAGLATRLCRAATGRVVDGPVGRARMNAPLGAAPERIWLAVEAVDMRLGIDGLSARIQASLGRSPCDGTAYAFTNRRRSRLKLLVWDGTGVWLSQRRLHRGYFTWPSASDPVFALTAAQWRWLIAGVDWQRRDAPAPAHWQV
jgi:transposase